MRHPVPTQLVLIQLYDGCIRRSWSCVWEERGNANDIFVWMKSNYVRERVANIGQWSWEKQRITTKIGGRIGEKFSRLSFGVKLLRSDQQIESLSKAPNG